MDDGFDPCECLFSHESAMQRLINMLRSTQEYCVDSECLTQMPASQIDNNLNIGSMNISRTFMLFVAWILIAVILYAFRPSSMRNGKPSSQRDSNDQNPPAPPIQ